MTEHPDSLIERGLTDDEAVTLARSGRDAGDPAPWGQVVKLMMAQRRDHAKVASLERLVRRGKRVAISRLLALLGTVGTGAKLALNHAAEKAAAQVRQDNLQQEVDEPKASLQILWRRQP